MSPHHLGGVGVLDPRSAGHHHHPADAEDPDVVPCHWRNGGPITLASDTERSCVIVFLSAQVHCSSRHTGVALEMSDRSRPVRT